MRQGVQRSLLAINFLRMPNYILLNTTDSLFFQSRVFIKSRPFFPNRQPARPVSVCLFSAGFCNPVVSILL